LARRPVRMARSRRVAPIVFLSSSSQQPECVPLLRRELRVGALGHGLEYDI
jgi:hypothetical protein